MAVRLKDGKTVFGICMQRGEHQGNVYMERCPVSCWQTVILLGRFQSGVCEGANINLEDGYKQPSSGE